MQKNISHKKLISHDFELGDSEDETLYKKNAQPMNNVRNNYEINGKPNIVS